MHICFGEAHYAIFTLLILFHEAHAMAGDDALLLATGLAIEPLLAKTPPPPHIPPCSGCTAKYITFSLVTMGQSALLCHLS